MSKRMQLAAAAGILFGLAAFAPTADAAQVCGPHDKIITALGEQFNENRKSLGLVRGAAVVELFVSIGGSWTLVATDTKGLACLIGAGEAWQDAPHVATGQDS